MPRSREAVAHDVVRLSVEGMSRRAIARSLSIARKTVSKMLKEHERHRHEGRPALPSGQARAKRASQLDPFRPQVERLLSSFSNITAQRVFEELRGTGYRGGYTGVKDLVRTIRPKARPAPSLKTPVFGPGRMAECDFSPMTVTLGGDPTTVQFFSYVLCYSRRKRFSVFDGTDLHAVMDGHVEAFAALGGAAEEVRYDIQKPVVLRWEAWQPLYNPRFIDFATYYEFRPRACRPGHPNDKPKVERSFWELDRSFLNGRRFTDRDDLRRQLGDWMTTISDERKHRKTGRIVREMFDEERAHLRPLPTHAFDTARVVYRLCDIEGFVSWDGNRYAVPYEYVTDILPLRLTQTEVFVYGPDLSLVARHERRPKGAHEDVEQPGQHPGKVRGADLSQLETAFVQMGPAAEVFFAGLKTHRSRSAVHHARQILQLRQRFSTDDLGAALEHATRFGAYEHASVERILSARAAPRRLPEYVHERLQTQLGEPLVTYDLTVYDQIPSFDPEAQ